MTAILSAVPTYLSVSSNETAKISAFAKNDPKTKADIAYLQKVAPNFTTVDAFLKDYRAVSIVLDAFGTTATAGQTGLLKKLLTQDPTQSSSFAVKSGDPTLQKFAKAMQQWSPPPFQKASNVTATITALATNRYEASLDTQAPGMADALYFKRQASGITNVNQILADPKLLAVVTAASNLPDQFGTMDYTQQVALLTKQVKFANFQKPALVESYIKRYLVINATNQTGATDPTGALAVLQGSGTASNVLSALLPTNSSKSNSSILSLFA